MRKWFIALVMFSIVALVASTILLVPNIIAGFSEAETSRDAGRLGHVEFIPADSIESHEVEVSPGVISRVTEVSGTLPGNTMTEPFIVYANRLGPFAPGKISWKIESLSSENNPVSITLIDGGNSVWTSAFSPAPRGYIVEESPTFDVLSDSYIVVANNNDASVTYAISITNQPVSP